MHDLPFWASAGVPALCKRACRPAFVVAGMYIAHTRWHSPSVPTHKSALVRAVICGWCRVCAASIVGHEHAPSSLWGSAA